MACLLGVLRKDYLDVRLRADLQDRHKAARLEVVIHSHAVRICCLPLYLVTIPAVIHVQPVDLGLCLARRVPLRRINRAGSNFFNKRHVLLF